MEEVIDSGDVVESEPDAADIFDNSPPPDSYGNPNEDLSIFEIDGDYDPEETDGKVH